MRDLRIVFMGTPDFAVGILKSLVENNYNIVGVITAPDKPAGRGQKLATSAVKVYATSVGLNVLQPTNLKDESFLQTLHSLNANLQIVVAFRMLPEVVWRMPELGTFNLHASLLPAYRGAAPINWAIINGETTTGVTTFFIDDKIDTGAVILKEEITIESTDDMGTLHDKLMHLGEKTVLKTLDLIKKDQVALTLQDVVTEHKTAYKLNRENCKIDWQLSGTHIVNLIRGLSPYPAAWTSVQHGDEILMIKIYKASFKMETHDLKTGTIVQIQNQLLVALHDGFLVVESLQLPNKRRMDVKDVLNGFSFKPSSFCF
ncbi:MAG: methionyl-tRNA formyltransferase [Flavobacterium sp.]